MEPERILEGLNEYQREAVVHFTGPLLILAGAGSGKTRVITHRVAYLMSHYGIPGENILGVTFTNKAAEEMRTRVEALLGLPQGALARDHRGPWLRTFHATGARILREGVHLLSPDYNRDFTILDEHDSREAVGVILKELGIPQEELPPGLVATLIARAKDELIGPEELERRWGDRLEGSLLERLAEVYRRYQRRLERSNALDFADLIRLTVRLFQEHPEVLDLYRRRFRFILIDEYQDINYAQYVLARLLAGDEGNICVVGDDDQAIYGWRGADPSWLLRFERDFPQAKVVNLRFNYRSPRRFLRAAQALIRHNAVRKEKELEAVRPPGEPIRVYEAADEEDEAEFVAQEIARLRLSGVEPHEIAVLYRINTLSRVLEEVLARAGIPYEIVRGLRFYERMEVKDVLAYLRVLANPADDLSLLRIINRPRRGIGERTLAALRELAEERGLTLWEAVGEAVDSETETGRIAPAARRRLREFLTLMQELHRAARDGLRPGALAELVLKRTGYLESLMQEDGSGEERVGNVLELVAQLREFEAEGGDLQGFLEKIALISDADAHSGEERVALMTLHVAKGLEFKAVFIVGLEDGLLPHGRSVREGALEEERRLLYVGLTRAKEFLYLSYAVRRTLYGSPLFNPPSRFLAELPREELVWERAPMDLERRWEARLRPRRR